MARLEGQVALISCAARGQGAAEARLFAAEGAKVVLVDVLDAEGQAVADSIGDAAHYQHLDVTDEASWAEGVAAAEDRFGPVTTLINNAGIFRLAPMVAVSLDDYLDVINVNQVGVFLGMKAVVPSMQSAGGGSIINISSIDGMIGSSNSMAYVASKFAVRGMTKVAAIELGPLGIRVNSIHPGGIRTPMITEAGIEEPQAEAMFGMVPLRRIGESEEVANLALYLASEESSYSTGSEFVVDGGWTAGFSLGEE